MTASTCTCRYITCYHCPCVVACSLMCYRGKHIWPKRPIFHCSYRPCSAGPLPSCSVLVDMLCCALKGRRDRHVLRSSFQVRVPPQLFTRWKFYTFQGVSEVSPLSGPRRNLSHRTVGSPCCSRLLSSRPRRSCCVSSSLSGLFSFQGSLCC